MNRAIDFDGYGVFGVVSGRAMVTTEEEGTGASSTLPGF